MTDKFYRIDRTIHGVIELLEYLEKTTKNLSQDFRNPDRDSNRELTE
jgi:hypothetical protein